MNVINSFVGIDVLWSRVARTFLIYHYSISVTVTTSSDCLLRTRTIIEHIHRQNYKRLATPVTFQLSYE